MKVFLFAACLLALRFLLSHPHTPEGIPFPEKDMGEITCQLLADIPSGDGVKKLHRWTEVQSVQGESVLGEGYYHFIITSDIPLFRGQFVHLKKIRNGFSYQYPFGYSCALWKLRSHIIIAFRKRIERLNRTDRAFMETLLLGIKSVDSGRMAQLFREAGCAHLLALSGFHLAYLAMLIGFLLQMVLGKGAAAFITRQTLLLGYSCLAGAGPSLLRAFLMRFIRDLGAQWGVRLTPGLVFFISFVGQLFLFPDSLYSLSFQLSYAAIAGILFFLPILDFCFSRFIPRKIVLMLAVPSAAIQFSLPFMLYYFGSWHWCGFIFSFILSPLILLYLTLGLLYLLLPIGFLAGALRIAYSLINEIAGYSVYFEPIRVPESIRDSVSLLLFLFNLSILALVKVNQIVRIRKRSFQFKL